MVPIIAHEFAELLDNVVLLLEQVRKGLSGLQSTAPGTGTVCVMVFASPADNATSWRTGWPTARLSFHVFRRCEITATRAGPGFRRRVCTKMVELSICGATWIVSIAGQSASRSETLS